MEDRISDPLYRTELTAEKGVEADSSYAFNTEGPRDEELHEMQDTADLGSGDRVLNGDPGHYSDLYSGEGHHGNCGCYYAEPADLDEDHDHDPAEQCPFRRRVKDDQSGHTGRGSRSKEGIQEGDASAAD